MSDPVRIAVFASGRGSNFRAIHAALVSMGTAPAAITLCISNNPNPGAFDYARENGIEAIRLSPKMFSDPLDYQRALMELLLDRGIELIVLAGYMRKLPPEVVETYRGRILNIHPALLPDFGGQGMYGSNVHEAVIAAGASESGASVHLVDEEYDTGAVVAQERVPVLPDDTPETLAARVLEAEHRLYPRVVAEWAEQIRSKSLQ
jgi:phosphoribosylglycinamide formyltransferase-1